MLQCQHSVKAGHVHARAPTEAHRQMMTTMAVALKASAAAHRSSLGAWTAQGASITVASARSLRGCPSLSSHRLMLCTRTCTAGHDYLT